MPKTMTFETCGLCAKPLSEEEQFYYGVRCGECERDHLDRVEAWRNGGEDKELEAMFAVRRILHS